MEIKPGFCAKNWYHTFVAYGSLCTHWTMDLRRCNYTNILIIYCIDYYYIYYIYLNGYKGIPSISGIY